MAPFVCACEARELPLAPLPGPLRSGSCVLRGDEGVARITEARFLLGFFADLKQLGRNVLDAGPRCAAIMHQKKSAMLRS